jgi:molecular chaperone DnaK (HSP70)
MDMTQKEWNEMISPIIDNTIVLTKRMLEKIKSEHMTIDKTILIGGSSRIPLVKEKLSKILPYPPVRINDLDVAVANGAAVYINQGNIPVKKCFCRKCGHEITTKMKFCPYCGADNIRYDYRFNDHKYNV